MSTRVGTNTDAVLLDPTRSGPDAVISSYKATTGTDVTTGINEAVRALLRNTGIPPVNIRGLMIGTTVCLFRECLKPNHSPLY
jgi:N-methylhydantoinase A/oxoprolinase/acetone carboxylase beta subunit